MLPVIDSALSEQSQSGQGVWLCNAAMICFSAAESLGVNREGASSRLIPIENEV